MRWTYNNTENNPNNRQRPPARVMYGPFSTNEMAEVWLQTLLRNPGDRQLISRVQAEQDAHALKEGGEARLAANPEDFDGHLNLGIFMLREEKLAAALSHFEAACRAGQASEQAHYYRALTLRMLERNAEAISEFQILIGLNPNHARGHGNLAALFAQAGDYSRARIHVKEALRINPEDPVALHLQQLLTQVK